MAKTVAHDYSHPNAYLHQHPLLALLDLVAFESGAGSIAGNGSTIVFHSEGDPLGLNPDLLWEVFAIEWDGTGLRQLTYGPYHDGSPVCLPDGRIVFCSTRVESSIAPGS